MKKIFVLIALLLLPIGVFAATEPKVVEVAAEVDGNRVKYRGTTEDGVTAVMCKLFDTEGEEVDQLSSAVDNKEFLDEFTNVAKGKYTVSCAKYEGGEFATSEEVEVVEEITANNPQTFDGGIVANIVILTLSIAGITGAVIYLKKKRV